MAKAWTCTPSRETSPSPEDWRILYAFLDYEAALGSSDLYGEWVWEVDLDLDPECEDSYCYSSGEGDQAYGSEWAIHPWEPWVMYSPDRLRECRLVSAPGCQ